MERRTGPCSKPDSQQKMLLAEGIKKNPLPGTARDAQLLCPSTTVHNGTRTQPGLKKGGLSPGRELRFHSAPAGAAVGEDEPGPRSAGAAFAMMLPGVSLHFPDLRSPGPTPVGKSSSKS